MCIFGQQKFIYYEKTSTYFICYCRLFASQMLAQSLVLKDNDGNSITGMPYSVSGTPTDLSETKFKVQNVTGNTIDYKIKTYEISNPQGSDLQVCFGQACYTSTAGQSGAQIVTGNGTVAGNSTDNTLKIAPFAFAWPGNTSATWAFVAYDMNNPNDSAATIATWTTWATGVSTVQHQKGNFAVFPNPANDLAKIAYHFQTTSSLRYFVLFDILGNEVLQIPVNNKSGELSLDVSSYSSGIYMYSFRTDGKIAETKKLVITH